MADLVTGPVNTGETDLNIPGVRFERIPSSSDPRGSFAKPYTRPLDSPDKILEVFWSYSTTGVVRGLHVQGPRSGSAKSVFLTEGRVLDVILDLRRSSHTYGHFRCFVLDPGVSLHIPHGCAHGFQALEPSRMVYLCDAPYDPASDHGVRFDSLGIPWPIPAPTVSERDLSLPPWAAYETPFP